MPEPSGIAVLERTADELAKPIDPHENVDPYGYLRQAWPDIASLVSALLGSLKESRQKDAHACFWLLFLRRYDQLTRAIRTDLDDEQLDPAEIDGHLSAIRAWLQREVVPVIDRSGSAGTFQRNLESGKLHKKSAYRLFAGLESMKPDTIMEYELLIFEMPSRVTKLLSDTVLARGD